jgi:hypothetical protein
MEFMFDGASSFNQNLCPWGAKLPTASVGNMFLNSGCPNTSNPAGLTGPWCSLCVTPTASPSVSPSQSPTESYDRRCQSIHYRKIVSFDRCVF